MALLRVCLCLAFLIIVVLVATNLVTLVLLTTSRHELTNVQNKHHGTTVAPTFPATLKRDIPQPFKINQSTGAAKIISDLATSNDEKRGAIFGDELIPSCDDDDDDGGRYCLTWDLTLTQGAIDGGTVECGNCVCY